MMISKDDLCIDMYVRHKLHYLPSILVLTDKEEGFDGKFWLGNNVCFVDGRLGIYLYCVKLKVFLLCIMENTILFIISSILSWVDENPWIDLGIIETSDNAQCAFF